MAASCNLFAILGDGSVRKINLVQNIVPTIKKVFLDAGSLILNADTVEVEFDSNYNIEEGEVNFIKMPLADELKDVNTNAINAPILDLENDAIKTLFWVEQGTYYFQTFDSRKLLRNKNVIIYDKQTFSKLEENAFIIDNNIQAIYKDGKLYFTAYSQANRVFSLIEFYHEATHENMVEFTKHEKVVLDSAWFMENSNTIMRKHVGLLLKSDILKTADTKKIKSSAKKFKLTIDLDAKGKIVFPNEVKSCREILTFLNEQYYFGVITGTAYKTNSKRNAYS